MALQECELYLTAQNPAGLEVSYDDVNSVQKCLFTPKNEHGQTTVIFTHLPKSITLNGASGLALLKGLPYKIKKVTGINGIPFNPKIDLNYTGPLNWRGIKSGDWVNQVFVPSHLFGFHQFNISTKIGMFDDALVIRGNKTDSDDVCVNITDLSTANLAIDFNTMGLTYLAGDWNLPGEEP